MRDTLAQLHEDTYDALASEYESRVETYRQITTKALMPFVNRLPKAGKVLDVGCAVGYTIEILNMHGMTAEGIDISPAMIAYARKRNPNVKLIHGDFLDAAYEPESFDGALLYAFIHLFPKDVAILCMQKVVSILKSGGLIFIGTTKSNISSEGFEEKADYGSAATRFRKRWTQQEIEGMFTDLGLEIAHYEDNIDEFGKVWMDYVLRKSTRQTDTL